jgi:proteasome accessory factor C
LLPLELTEAIEQKTNVLLEYVDASDARTEREIRPLEVRRLKGELVLIAHCLLRNDRRNFKLDRIVQLKRIEPVPAEPSADANPQPEPVPQLTLFGASSPAPATFPEPSHGTL